MKQRKFKSSIVTSVTLVYLGMVFLPVRAEAATQIDESIFSDTHWTLDMSPIQIVEDIYQTAGTILTIDSGVVVEFSPRATFTSYGDIYMEGTMDQLIQFRPKESHSDFWNIAFVGDEDDQVSIHMNNVSFGSMPSQLYVSYAKVEAHHITIREGAGIYTEDSDLALSKVRIQNIQGEGIAIVRTALTLDSFEVNTAQYGSPLALYDNSRAVISGGSISDISYASDVAVYNSSLEALNFILTGGGFGGLEIYGDGSSVTISSSTIKNHDYFEVYESCGCLISAENIWWGDKTGPSHEDNISGQGGVVYGTVDFEPWIDRDPDKQLPSLLFFPGIQASRLFLKEAGQENQLWEPNRKKDIEKLFLDGEGNSILSGIEVGEVIDEINIVSKTKNVYRGVMELFDNLKSGGKIREWKAFPYDWRFDVFSLAEASTLLNSVRSFMEQNIGGDIYFVAHSNGGLLAKALILTLSSLGPISPSGLILIGSPQLGTPQAVASLIHGDGLTILKGLILDAKTALDFALPMKSLYGLLPLRLFQGEKISRMITFDDETQRLFPEARRIENQEYSTLNLLDLFERFPIKAGTTTLRFPEPRIKKEFVELSDSQYQLFEGVDLDSIHTTQIVGRGIDTISGIHYQSKEFCKKGSLGERLFLCNPSYVTEYIPKFSDGDGTVVSTSASALGATTYLIDLARANRGFRLNHTHADMLENEGVKLILENILAETSKVLPDYVSLTQSPSGFGKIRIGVHSPVNISVSDSSGNIVGVVFSDGEKIIVEDVPNGSYREYGGGKYILLDDQDLYKLKVEGFDFGEFTLKIEYVSADGVVHEDNEFTFYNVPVGPNSVGTAVLGGIASENKVSPVLVYSPNKNSSEYALQHDVLLDETNVSMQDQIVFEAAFYCRDRSSGELRLKSSP